MLALQQALQKPNATWRNEGQKLAVMECLKFDQDVVAILPTGSGKTAVVITTALLEKNKVTIVLCPLKSLLQDWVRRLDSINFSYEVFHPSKPFISGQKPIVLVSLDVTDGISFRSAAASIRPDIPINRFVIDEAHLVLTESNYRKVMTHVKELRVNRSQLLLLTATLPPSAIAQLPQTFTTTARLAVIRCSSNRPELKFHRTQTFARCDNQVSTVA